MLEHTLRSYQSPTRLVQRLGAIRELGNEAVVDSLPGVPGGSSFVGTFDREEAVEDESIDFFASGHPLVEGVLAYFEDYAAKLH